MPAKDKYHDAVVRALEKEGWSVNAQFALLIGERTVWVDLKANRDAENISILIEIKGFENMASPVDYLARTVGQYVLYQSILEWNEEAIPLYLAVPEVAYEGFFQEPVGQAVIRKTQMKLLVVDVIAEEIITWIG
jgi:hypothetical protein